MTGEDDLREKVDRLESLVERQRERIADLERRVDGSGADHEDDDRPATATADPDPGDGANRHSLTRRSALKTGGLLGLLGFGTGFSAARASSGSNAPQQSPSPQGQVGTEDRPLQALYTQSVDGPLTGGTELTDLAGSGLTINAGALEATATGAWADDDGDDLLEPAGAKAGVDVTDVRTDSLDGGVTGNTGIDSLLGTNLTTETSDGETALSAAPAGVDVSDGFDTIAENVDTLAFEGDLDVVTDSEGEVTVGANTAGNTQVNVSDDGATVTENTSDIDFGSALTATDDGDGTVSVSGSPFWTDSNGLLRPTGSYTGIDVTDVQTDSLNGPITGTGNTDLTSLIGTGLAVDSGALALASGGVTTTQLATPLPDLATLVGTPVAAGARLNTGGNGIGSPDAMALYAGGSRALRLGTPQVDDSGYTTGRNVVAGHPNNTVNNDAIGVVIGGGGANNGSENTVGGNFATVGGGESNTASGRVATVGGGDINEASAYQATVGGGFNNTASGYGATAGGGLRNTASGERATVGGGDNNEASGNYATVPGGRKGQAKDAGSFVWADSTDATFASDQAGTGSSPTGADTFHVRATGGVRFVTGLDANDDPNAGSYLSSGGSSWQTVSARAAKQSISPVDPESVLEGIEELDVSTWEYESNEGVRRMGPMAGDFYDAFELGEDPETIGHVDADGVALAAIQGLSAKVDTKDDRIDSLEAESATNDDRIEALEAENEDLRDRLGRLETAVDRKDDRIEKLETENEQMRERLTAVEAELGLDGATTAEQGMADD